ncbi:hypothetical protein PSTG_09145 [Puccinia striiformis f. sp. tritici PST-78]|uniref:ABC transporter domain-containing protein n=1 Tax=Puccinia striiformis f. sp. tritici PST-78 TaxID=1165861 RepID=A0A0L0VEI1_9BASI|nr:hypothetical protein PSTG_09145 [Puccinia striiformis f. sp. tritici PST-78]
MARIHSGHSARHSILVQPIKKTSSASQGTVNKNNEHERTNDVNQPSIIRQAQLLQSNTPPGCPPCPECFNCKLPKFNCKQYGTCSEYDGQCKCPAGFGGQDCSQPVCGSLARGDERHVRQDNSTSCSCDDGWTGINCNVCQNDQVCTSMLSSLDDSTGRPNHPSARSIVTTPERSNKSEAVCYKGGYTVKESFQMCNITNRKIVDMLPGRPPEGSLSCDMNKKSCQFQFWVGHVESFYCEFAECEQSIQVGYEGQPNITRKDCNKMQCKCIPGRMLCGEAGSVDISDFLSEEIKGPGKFSCSSDGGGCQFSEPALDQLITDVFGDTSITLDCQAGECMHYTMVPGFKVPERPDNSKMVAFSIALSAFFVAGASWLFWYCGRNRAHKYPAFNGRNRQHSDEQEVLSTHVPTDLTFSKITYAINETRTVLREVSGKAKSGELMAIMGASGAGKSSLLDILAKKSKAGFVTGDILINDMQISNNQFKSLIAYVDQEDTLMSTLTVYEAVLFSAMLRLPKNMTLEDKKIRTLETLDELGILHLKDSFIGRSGQRSISGGEKRRVSIACELVTNPSILFLDEPTSGLDSFNAFNVVESLAQLAKNYQRTIILTIHQPQSNIVTLFDQLILLGSGGRLIYSGAFATCNEYFTKIGHPCPTGYNIADFLIDLTMKYRITRSKKLTGHTTNEASTDLQRDSSEEGQGNYGPEAGGDETELLIRRSSGRSRVYAALGAIHNQSGLPEESHQSAEDFSFLDQLRANFQTSEIYQSFDQHFKTVQERGLILGNSGVGKQLHVFLLARSSNRVGFIQQFLILSGRAFKNLYRNPMLMLSHYLLAILLAAVCASLFHGVTLDIAGFQGRMGLFFFILALFGFSSLTAITIFSQERIIFIRERSNNYYSPISYFLSKTILDILPLRILPPFILACIIYYPVGLVPTLEQFWKFVLVLIGFNLVSFSLILFISLILEDVGVANLVGSLITLFNLLFAGLLVNREKLPYGTAWLLDISYYHAAFEGLLVNEVRYLTLKDRRYGVDIEVPSASILSLFGFRATAFWYPDVINLAFVFTTFMFLSFLTLVYFVKERR